MKLLFLILFIIISAPGLTSSKMSCAELIQDIGQVKSVKFDRSVELELSMEHNLMDILTTTDGTVGSLLAANNKRAPKWYSEYVEKNLAWGLYETNSVPWSILPYDTKLKLLQHVSKNRSIPFFENREVLGIKVKDKLEFRFLEKTIFMGREYQKGNHLIDVSQVIGKVEYRSPDDMKLNIGLELHFREGLNASSVSHDARVFLQGLRIKPTHQHVHITSKLPLAKMKKSPEAYAIVLTDFYARANMAAEMFDIIYNSRAIKNRHHSKDKSIILFDYLSDSSLSDIQRYFELFGLGRKTEIGSRFKMAWVGLRGFDTYDGDSDLWSLEFRANLFNEAHDKKGQILEGIQEAMFNHRYGISAEAAEKWMDQMSAERSFLDFADSYYNKQLDVDNLSDELSKKLSAESKLRVEEIFRQWGKDHRELYMLTHDWSTSPIFYKKKIFLKKILESQEYYLNQLVAQKKISSEKLSKTISSFLKDSNLFISLLESLGIKNFQV